MTHQITSTHRADVIEILRDERATIREVVAPTFNDWGVLIAHGRYEVWAPLRASRTDNPFRMSKGRTPDEAVEDCRDTWGEQLRHAPFIFEDSVFGVPV